jgi:hypothetical protein
MSPAPKAYVSTGRRTRTTVRSKRVVLNFGANDIVTFERRSLCDDGTSYRWIITRSQWSKTLISSITNRSQSYLIWSEFLQSLLRVTHRTHLRHLLCPKLFFRRLLLHPTYLSLCLNGCFPCLLTFFRFIPRSSNGSRAACIDVLREMATLTNQGTYL